MKVGFVTIGQSPRTDIVSDIAPLLAGVEIVESGALDFLEGADIARMAPEAQGEDFPLASRLREGTPVVLSKQKIYPLLQEAVNRVVAHGASMVVVLCAEEWEHLTSPVLTLFPDRLLAHFVRAVLPEGSRLGVLVPLAEQIPRSLAQWSTICPETRVISLSPYRGFEAGIEVVQDLEDCTLIVMPCLGYSTQHKAMVQRHTGAPVVLARTVIARVVQEILFST